MKKEFWNPIKFEICRQFFVKNRFQEFFHQFLLLKKLNYLLSHIIIVVVTVVTPKWRWRNTYIWMVLLGFFRTSIFYNRIWDDRVVLTFFYDTVSKVGYVCFYFKTNFTHYTIFGKLHFPNNNWGSSFASRKIVPMHYCLFSDYNFLLVLHSPKGNTLTIFFLFWSMAIIESLELSS